MKDLYISKDLSASRIIVNKQRSSDSSLIGGEINELRAQISKTHDNVWNGSVLQVLFKNEDFSKKYRVKIEKFLKDLLEEGEEFIVCHPPHNNSEQDHEDKHQSFHIDRVTCESNSKDKLKQNVPHYSSHFEDTLSTNKTETEEKPAEKKPSMFTCFNCLGNHHMKECSEKMDRLRINANKKEILSGNSVRYHTEEQNNSLKAGILSNELRTALGLRKDQLPQFIYNMRVIGYPPGWMDEAVLEKSGLSLYDTDGKGISVKPAVTEEKNSSSSPKGTLYDGSKFVEFPGFNTPIPKGFVDEWKTLNMPSLQPHQQLKEALKSPNIITSSNAYKRRQFPSADDLDSKKSKNVDEMPCSPQSNEVSKHDSTCHLQPALNFDHKTPESDQSNKRSSMSISKSPGTPILEQGNPYQKLPAADKFAQGITEHLPFENLPDAVGTYEKMRGIISCVQKKLNYIQCS